MSLINSIFLVLLVAAAFLSMHNRRGLLWLALLSLNYAGSCIYWRMGWPNPEFAVAILDFSICIAVLIWGKQEWDMWIWMLFQTSMLAGILYLANNIWNLGLIDHEAYSIVMELIMGTALVTIGAVGAWDRAGFADARAFRAWTTIFGFVRPLYREEKARGR